jgi:membrane protease YdiL (CAAX protease family)
MNSTEGLKPLPFRMALLYFGIPAVGAVLVVYALMPLVAARGVPIFFNYLLVYASAPMLALIVASLIAYRMEGNALSWSRFKTRFRLHPMGWRSWVWAIGLMVFMFLSAGALSFTARWLASFPFLAPPDHWPAELKAAASSGPAMETIPTELMGIPLAGNWWVLFALLASLVLATLGEELWWRGYILPRQELVHGKRTWIVHGLLWASFHLFAPWNLIVILPGCLALSYVAQKLKNTWPVVIAHGLANGLTLLIVVVLGITG